MRVVMMLSRLMGIGKSVAGADRKDSREGDDGSHQHGLVLYRFGISVAFD
jgi:hypothetical protein